MLENNNGRAVRQIIFRTISFRRARNTILVFLIFCCMSVLTLLGMGIAAEFEHLHATLLEWQGTDAHLILEGVTKEEKERIQIQPQVRKIGAADVIGEVKNPELIYRRPKMICPDKMFLKQNRRGALHGSLPEKEDEIVVDETTLTDLGVNKKVGETVKLVWEKDGKKMESSFVLSGYLEMKGADGKNGDLWLSHKFAQKFSGNRLQVQVRFALPFGIAKNAEKLISTCGIQHAEVEINDVQKISIYLRNLMEQQNEVIMMLFLYLAGYFVFRSMFQIAAVTDLEYKDAWDVSDTDLQSMDGKRDTFMCSGCSSGDFICAFVWKNCLDTDRMECIHRTDPHPCLAARTSDCFPVFYCVQVQQKGSEHY